MRFLSLKLPFSFDDCEYDYIFTQTFAMNSGSEIYIKIIKTCHNLLFGIKKHKIAFIISMLIGLAPLMLKYQSDLAGHEASFTVAYDELVRKIYGDRLLKINTLITQKDYKKTATFLGIKESTVKALLSVKGTNILGEDLSKDMNTDRIPFIVTITVKDTSQIPELQKGIINFLEFGNDYMLGKNKIKKAEIAAEIEFIDSQLDIMDSIKRKMSTGKLNMDNSKEANNMAPVFQFSYDLYKKKQDLLRKQEMPSNLQVVDDAIVSKSTGRSIIIHLVIGLFAGWIIYLFTIGFILPVINYKE